MSIKVNLTSTIARQICCLATAMALTAPQCFAQCVNSQASSPVTYTDEVSNPSSRQLINGSGTSVNLNTPSKISIDANYPAALNIATYSSGGVFTAGANSYTRITSATGINLPGTASLPVGSTVALTIGGAQGATTINTNAGANDENIIFNGSTTNNTLTIKNGDQILLANQGSGTWMVISFLPQGSSASTWTVIQGGTGSSTASGARTNLSAAASGANSDITSLSGLSTALSVAQGGTGSTTAAGARTNLSAAESGANSDITSLSGLSTALSVAQGGTGAKSLTAHGVVIGNGASALNVTSTGSAGQVLVSNGSSADPTWQNAPSPTPESKRVSFWTPILTSSTTYTVSCITAPTSMGTHTNNKGSAGNLLKHTTSTTINTDAGYRATAFDDLQRQFNGVFTCKVQTSATSITGQRIWVGLFNSDVSGSGTITANGAGFRFDTGQSDSEWKCVTSDGSSNTVTGSGVSVASGTTYIMRIDMSDQGNVRFYIDNNLVATNTTTLPTTTADLGVEMVISNLQGGAGSAKDFSTGTMRLESY